MRARAQQTRRRASAAQRAPARATALQLDSGLLAAIALLVGIGVVMSYSTTAALDLEHAVPPLFLDHLRALLLGLLAAAICVFLPPRMWRAIALPAWGLTTLMLVATDLFGTEVNGAQRWLEVPGLGFRFQPVELAKVSTLVAVASLVARRDGKHELDDRRALSALGLAAVPIGLLARQPDLGNAVLIGALTLLLLFAAGAPLRRLAVPSALAAGLVGFYVSTHPYALRRVTSFLRPWEDAQGAGFQLVQSFVAFNNGGLLGAGLGNGRQKLSYLPEGHTDFILALIAEELGLVGVLVVLGGFAALWVAGTRVARNAPDRFALLLGLAMTALLTVPAALNAAVVMGLVPTKGLTLPFLSYGGTSLVICCAAAGVLLAVGRPQAAASAARGGGRASWR